MTTTSKSEAARILRSHAQDIRRHGFTNMFAHHFVCVLAQVLRPETCAGCLLRDYVPEEYRDEAFPCQHLDEETTRRIASLPGMPEKVAAGFISLAEELEAEAGGEHRRAA